MSTLNKYDLLLIGNITIDEVYETSHWAREGTSNDFKSYKQAVGGLGNIIQALKNSKLQISIIGNVGNNNDGKIIKKFLTKEKINHNLSVCNDMTSKALIITNTKSKERTSFVNWGCGKSDIEIANIKSNWAHISYLDIVPYLNFKKIKETSDYISADLCLSSPSQITITKILNQLQYLDYLFVSESEINSITNGEQEVYKIMELVSQYGLKNLVFHKREETLIVSPKSYKHVTNNQPILENISVLGAGDAYCANFIKYQLLHDFNNEKAATYAHEEATKFLVLKRNEKV